MAQITITIADAQLSRVVDAICIAGSWNPDLGITKNAFAKAFLVNYVKSTVLSVEYRQAQETALSAVVMPDEADVS